MTKDIALVTGGCGCVGFHIVKVLLEEPTISAVHVFSRNPSQNRIPRAVYHTGSITSELDIENLFQKVQPTVIFHVASPVSSGNTATAKLFYDVNVEGTKTLLNYSQKTAATKALIYTSSSSVAKPPYHFTTEDKPMISVSSITDFNYYTTTKAIADTNVLKANNSNGLRTCCLRIAPIYGERDNQMIPGVIKVMDDNRQHNQIGDNSVLMDFLSAKNAARAHILAYRALMSPDEESRALGVAGEAFFITDGKSLPFWDFSRKIWAAAGDRTPPDKIKIVPAWLVLGLAVALEWVYWVFTLGQKTPKFLRSHTIRYVTQERTFSIEKARTRLGYQPVDEMDQSIEDGVTWHLRKSKA